MSSSRYSWFLILLTKNQAILHSGDDTCITGKWMSANWWRGYERTFFSFVATFSLKLGSRKLFWHSQSFLTLRCIRKWIVTIYEFYLCDLRFVFCMTVLYNFSVKLIKNAFWIFLHLETLTCDRKWMAATSEWLVKINSIFHSCVNLNNYFRSMWNLETIK